MCARTAKWPKIGLTLEVRDNFAHEAAEYEVPQQLADEREGHAKDAEQQIRDGLKKKNRKKHAK